MGDGTIGTISGVNVYHTEKLKPFEFYIGDNEVGIERIYRQEKINKLLNRNV